MKSKLEIPAILTLLILLACGGDFQLPEPPIPALQTYHETRSLEEVWQGLITFLEENHPEVVASLRPPATDDRLDELEALIDKELPDAYRTLYKLADGQDQAANAPLFSDGYDFIPLDSVVHNWKMLDRIEKKSGAWGAPGGTQGPIWDRWFHPAWVPFARNIAGDHRCVDLAPAPGGSAGQVIGVIHDDTPRYHLGSRLSDYLGEFEQGLREGRYVMHPEWGVFTR